MRMRRKLRRDQCYCCDMLGIVIAVVAVVVDVVMPYIPPLCHSLENTRTSSHMSDNDWQTLGGGEGWRVVRGL